MEQNDNEVINSTNDTEETANDIEINLDEETNDESSEEETITIPKKKWTEALAAKDHWKNKATKPAETKPEVKSETKSDNLSSKDLIALMNAKVHEEDVSEIEDYAKYKGISITEALKSSVVKTLLQEKAQQRNVALATNTGSARTPSRKLSDDVILSNASKGNMPEDVDSLVSARFKAKKQK